MSILAKRATKRIMRDITYMVEEKVDKDGIYFWTDDDNIFKMKALIIGPSDTPYEGGFYFFDIAFPDTYPMKSPKVVHQTRTGRVRFNPNLYSNGKVCLSILGTWKGPSWTPTMNVLSILHSIQGMILNDCPLKNEPGYEKRSSALYDSYNGVLDYWNFKFATIDMANKPVKGFEMFHPQVIAHLLTNRANYIAHAQMLQEKYKGVKKVTCSYQSQLATSINYKDLTQRLVKLIKTLTKSHPHLMTAEEEGPCIATPDSDSDSDEDDDDDSDSEDNYDSMKKAALMLLCEAKGLNVRKVSTKTGNLILKTKAELIIDLRA